MNRYLTLHEMTSMSRGDFEAFQDAKFAAFVRYQAGPTSPYLREVFAQRGVDPSAIRSVADWHRLGLPLLRKVDYKRATERFVLDPWRAATGREQSVGTAFERFRAQERALGRIPAALEIASRPSRRVAVHFDMPPAPPASGVDDFRAQATAYMYRPFSAFHTGGTTGEPTPVVQTRYDSDLYRVAYARLVSRAAEILARRGQPCVGAVLYPFGIHKAWWAVNWGIEAAADYSLRAAGGGAIPTARLAALILREGANLLFGTPSYVRNRLLPALLDAGATHGLRAPETVVVCLGAEPILERVRREVRETFEHLGAREVVQINTFGSTEMRFNCFLECAEDTGYHGWSGDLVAVRVVAMRSAEDWEFVPPGESGYVVQFPLDGAGTVLPGFLTGDRARLLAERCERCGAVVDRLVDIGRTHDVEAQVRLMGLSETKVKGTTVNLTDLRERLLHVAGVGEVQLVIAKETPDDPASLDVLVVNVAPQTDAVDPTALAERVAQTCKAASEIRPQVRVRSLEQLLGTGVKFRAIVDDRPANGQAPSPATVSRRHK